MSFRKTREIEKKYFLLGCKGPLRCIYNGITALLDTIWRAEQEISGSGTDYFWPMEGEDFYRVRVQHKLEYDEERVFNPPIIITKKRTDKDSIVNRREINLERPTEELADLMLSLAEEIGQPIARIWKEYYIYHCADFEVVVYRTDFSSRVFLEIEGIGLDIIEQVEKHLLDSEVPLKPCLKSLFQLYNERHNKDI